MEGKYSISAGLFYPINSIPQVLEQVISIFFVLYKILWVINISLGHYKSNMHFQFLHFC